MEITQIDVYRVTLKYKEPFRISAQTTSETTNILVKLTVDNHIFGWGESSPSKRVTGETADTVMHCLDTIAPKLIGTSPDRIEHVADMTNSLAAENPAAKAPVDIALFDILGKAAGKPLFTLLGGYRTEVLTDFTLGIKAPKEMAKDAAETVKKGFKAIKVKVGLDPVEDVERIRLIREVIGDQIQLRIDANQGWTPDKAISALNMMSKFGIQFVEQPVAAADLKGLAKVRKKSSIPVMVDESVHSPGDVLRIVKAEAADSINIKLMKSGGILQGRKIAEVAESAGLPCMIGCMSESTIGIAAAAHLAAGIRNIQYADLDSDLMMADRVVTKGGVGIKDSFRTFSRKAYGLGIDEINAELLGKPVRVYS